MATYLKDLSVALEVPERQVLACIANSLGAGPYVTPDMADHLGADWVIDEALPWAVEHAPNADKAKQADQLRAKLAAARAGDTWAVCRGKLAHPGITWTVVVTGLDAKAAEAQVLDMRRDGSLVTMMAMGEVAARTGGACDTFTLRPGDADLED